MRAIATAWATALILATFAFAEPSNLSEYCPLSGVCFQLNIPDDTAAAGNGDIYFQIRAATRYQWVALGQGTQMDGSNMFVMYENGVGENVTVSTRLGKPHIQPTYDEDHAQITILEGSEVADGYMHANVLCKNCSTWPGGDMDFKQSRAQWIYAARIGRTLKSGDLRKQIHRHDESGTFPWDMQLAKGGDNPNPFLPGVREVHQSKLDGSNTGGSTGGNKGPGHLVKIHGGIAALVFVILFPTGGILIRLANFRGGMWIHVGLQALAWILAFGAIGLGIYLATDMNLLKTAHAHPIIGIVVAIIILGQPAYGWLHHRHFSRAGKRNFWSWMHIGAGRTAIFVGMVNGGLGLKLAGNTDRMHIMVYSVVTAVFALLYIVTIIYGELRLKKAQSGRSAPRGTKGKETAHQYARSDDQGLAAPFKMRPFRRGRDEMARSAESTEYVPLTGPALYGDVATSRNASPAPLSRAASPESRSRATSMAGERRSMA